MPAVYIHLCPRRRITAHVPSCGLEYPGRPRRRTISIVALSWNSPPGPAVTLPRGRWQAGRSGARLNRCFGDGVTVRRYREGLQFAVSPAASSEASFSSQNLWTMFGSSESRTPTRSLPKTRRPKFPRRQQYESLHVIQPIATTYGRTGTGGFILMTRRTWAVVFG